ncbi:hypothetical protein DFH05DRAFT_1468596 [Lentinula detonsa]|uniref:BRCA2 OB1 domain-containing protein n=1 Tax=Lentinula detonsa TaxID=2804962 RepID=A0A9W8U3E6_9AGAR|nr:hypothetical protein DFH05DRAFT_1468596 [Lentinula detonsa]
MSSASGHRYDRTPTSSPSRKRQKTILSSPVYPEMDLSQDELNALNEIETRLSQPKHTSQQGSPPRLAEPEENPFQGSSPMKPPAHAFSGFSTASAIQIMSDDAEHFNRSSPDPPEEKDYSSWFESTGIPTTIGFQTAKSASTLASSTSPSAKVSFPLFSTALVDKEQLSVPGFRTARKGSGLLAPSAAALVQAKEKFRTWQEDERESSSGSTSKECELSSRSPLRAVQNSILEPKTSCPQFASASQISNNFAKASCVGSSKNSSTFISPVIGKPKSQNIDINRPKPFKSPLLNTSKVPATPAQISPLVTPTFSSARLHHPLATTNVNVAFQTPVRPTNANVSSQFASISCSDSYLTQEAELSISAASITTNCSSTPDTPNKFTTPARRMLNYKNLSPAHNAVTVRTTPAKFVTPFKPGMKPGEAGRLKLEAQQEAQQQSRTPAKLASNAVDVKVPAPSLRINSIFDITPPPNRLSLSASGLLPQQYTTQDLIRYNIAIQELSQITTPSLALYYSFYTTPQPSDSPSVRAEDRIGPAAALDKLIAHGCSRATKAWIDNAWSLILWKLAGMVVLEPERETGAPTFGGAVEGPRWCWNEVWRQLLYRYEREMNLGIRTPFHLITTQDHPATAPMVLCISNIIWPEASSSNGQRPDARPQLEVTDGWYQLRAQIDHSMINAIKRGKLRVGRKIAVVGCKLETERKDPLEPLEAFQSTKLIIHSNSSQLAPWHAKLGFQRGPYIFTMHSLTPEGGNVTLMDVVVLQVHPVAYLEICIGPDGKKYQEGPRNEADETACKKSWRKKREAAESRIYDAHEKKVARYLSYAERLEQKGSRSGCSSFEDLSGDIDGLYEELEEPEDAARVISQTNGSKAACLALHIRDRLEKDRERVKDELEKEVDDICPPRNIRSFRVIIARDFSTSRFPANRTAQITIWDVMDLKLTEDRPQGHFGAGWRCRVTNLIPSSKAAWMGNEPGAQIFLVSTRVTKWQKMRNSG